LFNKKLSQLESIYQIGKPIKANPLHISDFVMHVFENQAMYNVKWNPDTMVTAHTVHNLLESRGHNISIESIKEGIKILTNEWML